MNLTAVNLTAIKIMAVAKTGHFLFGKAFCLFSIPHKLKSAKIPYLCSPNNTLFI